MRRKRCTYCKSLDTAEFVAATKDGTLTTMGWACNECENLFDETELEPDGARKKIPDTAKEAKA